MLRTFKIRNKIFWIFNFEPQKIELNPSWTRGRLIIVYFLGQSTDFVIKFWGPKMYYKRLGSMFGQESMSSNELLQEKKKFNDFLKFWIFDGKILKIWPNMQPFISFLRHFIYLLIFKWNHFNQRLTEEFGDQTNILSQFSINFFDNTQ